MGSLTKRSPLISTLILSAFAGNAYAGSQEPPPPSLESQPNRQNPEAEPNRLPPTSEGAAVTTEVSSTTSTHTEPTTVVATDAAGSTTTTVPGSPENPSAVTMTTTQEVANDPAQEHPFRRWRPRGFLTEVGVFGGAFWLDPDHELYGSAKTGDPTKWRDYPKILPQFGLRVGLYPTGFLGLEVEGSLLPTKAHAEAGMRSVHAMLWTGRGSLVLQLPVSNLVPFILAGGGALGIRSPDGTGEDTDGIVHFGGGLKYYMSRYASIRVEARDVIAGKRGGGDQLESHNLEVLGGFALTFGRPKPSAVAKTVVVAVAPVDKPSEDHDGDGIADTLDQCPNEAETANGFEDQDGCPESDQDGDGIWDKPAHDKCPTEVGVSPDGCPDRDPDRDGVLDPTDKCPDQAETANGFEDQDGCPDEVPKEEIAKFSGAIPGIQFESGSANITASSTPTLTQAVELLKRYPTLQLEISGHTDSVGRDDTNLALSQARAEAVKTYLGTAGIDPTRLTVQGYGETQPVADNRTKVGRKLNRRIEFKIREQ